MRRIPECEYTSLAESRGFEYLGGYSGSIKRKVLWRCSEGHEWRASYDNIKYRKSNCPHCAGKAPKAANDYHKLAQEKGISWVGDLPRTSRVHTDWACPNGHQWRASFHSVDHSISGCIQCWYDSINGDGHPRWNQNLTPEERERGRNYPEYDQWRSDVYERDYYSCQVCHAAGSGINAHHIFGYTEFPNMRTDTNNGITLCEDCHNDFHEKYGQAGAHDLCFLDFISQKGVYSV